MHQNLFNDSVDPVYKTIAVFKTESIGREVDHRDHLWQKIYNLLNLYNVFGKRSPV